MHFHSLVFDWFLEEPLKAREKLVSTEMKDEIGSDGVTYPGIVKIPADLESEIKSKLDAIFQYKTVYDLIFARFSLANMKPPHWAHSDKEMTDYVGLLYLNPPSILEDSGTFMVEHKAGGNDKHPKGNLEKIQLMTDSNNFEKWNPTFYFPSRFNRLVILSADYLHAASLPYGDTQESARLVISIFFKLKGELKL